MCLNNFHLSQIDSLDTQHNYLEKQHDSLEAASQPKQEELNRLEELKNIISAEEEEIGELMKGSKKLKDKVIEIFNCILPYPVPSLPFLDPDHSVVDFGPCVIFSLIFFLEEF